MKKYEDYREILDFEIDEETQHLDPLEVERMITRLEILKIRFDQKIHRLKQDRDWLKARKEGK